MTPRKSVLGVVAGVLLGLGVVVLASSGVNPLMMPAATLGPTPFQTNGTSTESVATTSTSGAPVYSIPSGSASTTTVSQSSSTGQGSQKNALAFVATVPAGFSHLNNIARQPIALGGFVLLPIFAALLFGFVVYRVSRARNEEEEPPETA
jgi:hypothetical protein